MDGDGLNLTRNALMLATVCGGVPLILKHTADLFIGNARAREVATTLTSWVLILPLLLAILAAMIATHSFDTGHRLFFAACATIVAIIALLILCAGAYLANVCLRVWRGMPF